MPANSRDNESTEVPRSRNPRLRSAQLKEDFALDLRMRSGFYDQLRALQHSALMMEMDFMGEVMYANLLMLDYLGADSETGTDALGLRALMESRNLKLPKALILAMLRGHVWRGTLDLSSAHGTLVSFEATITPVVSEDSNYPIKYVIIGFDVTRQKRQKENLMKMMKQEQGYIAELEMAKRQLEAKVDEKIREIKDSITYSERIQNALMPAPARLQELLPAGYEAAVLFKPRDQVSGDFFWAGSHQDRHLLAVGDATGHGIPGAFLSILGLGALARQVEERGNTNPGQILHAVDEFLLNTLGMQSAPGQVSVQDTIEMGIVEMQPNSGLVTYSSAMLSAFLVNSEEGLVDLRGARRPLGGTLHDRSLPFTNQTLELKPGDTLYLFSDGYHTQLGDQKNDHKPIGKRRFRNLVRDVGEIQSLPDRLSVLEVLLRQWQGPVQAQSDDILIIALRFKGA
jgi:serine phosphatase RsbU (regulator of sigma subunit)